MAVDDIRAAAAELARIAAEPLPFTPHYKPVAAGPTPQNVVAVDGSSALLIQTGSVWVGAVRAEAVAWPNPASPVAPAPRILVTRPQDAANQVEAEYAQTGFEAPRIAGAEGWLAAHQALAEWRAARQAAAEKAPFLLLDGAIRGLPTSAQALADDVVRIAERRNVPLVAVAKRSAASDGVVAKLWKAGPAGPWTVDVPGEAGLRVAKLHARAPHAFRVDVAGPGAELLEALVPLCKDAAYVGYPYPLALAHNRVALTMGRAAELKAALERELRRMGGGALALAADFHDVLDRNVAG